MAEKASMYDLAWSIEGDSVEVEQGEGFGDVASVTLHKVQLRMLASEMGLMRGEPDAWERVETLERRLKGLQRRIQTLDEWLAEDLSKQDVDLSLHSTFAEATADLAREYCADLSKAEATAPPMHSGRTAKSAAKTDKKPTGNPAETQTVSALRESCNQRQPMLPLEAQQ